MSVTTPVFRLKAAAGDTGLTDKKGSAGAMTGTATQTLIDRGSGEYAIRVAGGILSVAVPSRTVTSTPSGSGISWAMDIAIENYGTVEFNNLINIGSAAISDGSSTATNGIALARDGSGYVNFIKDDTTHGPAMSVGTTKHTISCRLTANQSGGYWLFEIWVSGMAHTGTNPDYTGPLAGYGTSTLSVLTINATNVTLNIRDLVIFGEELGNADHLAVAEGLRATVDAVVVNNPPTFSGTVPNITGTGGAAITPVDVHALFSDTDTLTYSASPAGTAWPSGLVINSSTGVISGTVATSTTTGLKVRATDTASQTVDSNAFSATISAPASSVSGVTVSPSTATVSGGGTQTFTASVAGTNSPSQTVNWSMTGAGSINASTGVYTAPAATSSAQTATITATSAQDGSKSGAATVTVPAASVTTSYVDMGTDSCDNIQSGLMPSASLTAVVFRRDDLSVAKQVITGITTTTGSLVPRFATTFAVGTPVHVVFINAADNTVTGIVSDHATVA